MVQPRIEIQDVKAHRADASGRVRGIRVLGVAAQRERKILVTLSPQHDGSLVLASSRFGAEEFAAFVRPATFGWSPERVRFAHMPGVDPEPPRGFLWCAEFDLDAHPRVPPITLGVQAKPWLVDARHLYSADDDRDATPCVVASLELVAAYPLGVLFVHGIGVQEKAETLSQWTAPLLGWINEWFDAASRRLGEQARIDDLDAWLATLLVRQGWDFHEGDARDRYSLAHAFADHAAARRYESPRAALLASARRALATTALRSLDPDEIAAGARFAQHLEADLGASIVGGTADLADARLIDGDAPAPTPSTVEVRIAALSSDGEVERSRWLMAESHWAESFRQPPFGPFGLWCLRAAPVIWVHYYAMIRARSKRIPIRSLSALVPIATVVLAMVVAFVLLIALGLIPWPRLRAVVLSVQRSLAGVVGDSYIFLKDVVQRRAIVDRVRRDVEWLSHRCRAVVVIAHSQGAAAADAALNNTREYDATGLDTLVTLGAGVQTLTRLGKLIDSKPVLAVGCMALAGVALFWIGLASLVLATAWWAGAAVATFGAGMLLRAGVRAVSLHPGLSTLPLYAGLFKPWHDFFATHDPVPWGPMADTAGTPGMYSPHEVRNRHSFLTDHTSYWENTEEVVGPVARLVAKVAGMTALERAMPDAKAAQQAVVAARRTRVAWLRGARLVAVLCTIALCVAQARSVTGVATWSWGLAAPRVGVAPETLAAFPGMAAILAALAVVVPWALYSTVVAGTWSAWGSAEAREILRSHRAVRAAGWRAGFAIAVAAMVAITAAIVAATTH